MDPKISELIDKSKRDISNPVGYLETGIFLAKKFNHFQALKNFGIFPSDENKISAEQVKDAFLKAYGVSRFSIRCKVVRETQEVQIEEIKMCLDLNYNPVDCIDIEGLESCSDNFIYPMEHRNLVKEAKEAAVDLILLKIK